MKPVVPICALCAQPMAGRRADAEFCSGRCRVRAWRIRQRRAKESR